MEKVVWNSTIRVINGPQIALSGSLDVEAYDKFTVTLAAGKKTTVALTPAGAGLQCLVINPKVRDAKLTYDNAGTPIALDAPHVLVGDAVNLAGSPASLDFDNATAADVELEILVGRDATP